VAALTATTITHTTAGTLGAPAAMSVADTIDGDYAGYILEVKNGAGAPTNLTFVDGGTTPAGNTGTQAPTAIAAGATRRFRLNGAFVDPDDGLFHLTLSSATSVTYELYK
jgi:hypothetical protein